MAAAPDSGVRDDLLLEAIGLHESIVEPASRGPDPRREPRDPERTIAAIEPFLAALGMTRLGDLTDLDVIGIPVWFACRPNARSLSVSQGKGLDEPQARVSAVMELIEHAIAERPERAVALTGSLRAIQQTGHATVPFGRIARCVAEHFDPDRERAWVRGISLRTGITVLAPYEMVGLDLRAGSGWDHAAFRMSSIGLAAGSTIEEAVLHGLLEVLEHGATATLEIFGLSPVLTRRLRYRPGGHPPLDETVERVQRAGLEPGFIDLTPEFGLPTIGAFIDRPMPGSVARHPARPCAGFACRLDPNEAAMAALLEAVQSRLTDIAGARDDIVPSDYVGASARLPPISEQTPDIGSISTFQPRHRDTVLSLRRALEATHRAGAGDAYIFPLDCGGMDVQVVRVVVSETDAPDSGGVTKIGIGALNRILAGGRA